MTGFGGRLADGDGGRGPLCLGIDPHPELLRAWGLPVDADGLRSVLRHLRRGVRRLRDRQTAGGVLRGLRRRRLSRCWSDTIAALRDAGVLVLADAKRGDIGSTMAAYAAAWAGDSPLAADAVTASPYLGFGSLRPLLDIAAAHGRGVFVLAATSNPEGASVQRAARRRTHGRAVDRRRRGGRQRARRPSRVRSASSSARRCRRRPIVSALGGPVLVPGVGAQGGRPEALRGFGGARPGQLLPAVSREVLRAGPDVGGVRAAAERMRDAVAYLAELTVATRTRYSGIQLPTEPEAPACTVAGGHRRHLLAVPVERLVVTAALVDAPVLPVHRRPDRRAIAVPFVAVGRRIAARRARCTAARHGSADAVPSPTPTKPASPTTALRASTRRGPV